MIKIFITSQIKQLQMDRNSKEMNLAIREFKTEHISCNIIVERPFLMNVNTLHF